MATDTPLRCSCGALRGVARGLSPARGNRLVCYCASCQAYAHALGRADEILDAHGGTDIFQMPPAFVEIAEGADRLACLRLRPGGLLRWHAACCRTPIGNTMATPQMPFVGLVHSCIDVGAAGSLDALLGPSRGGVWGLHARGDRAQVDAHAKAPPAMLLRQIGMLGLARLRGQHAPSPFFDPATGAPRVTPRVLSPDELRAAEAARDAA